MREHLARSHFHAQWRLLGAVRFAVSSRVQRPPSEQCTGVEREGGEFEACAVRYRLS